MDIEGEKVEVKLDTSKYEKVHGHKPGKQAPRRTWLLQFVGHKNPKHPDATPFTVGGDFAMCIRAAKKTAREFGFSIVEIQS